MSKLTLTDDVGNAQDIALPDSVTVTIAPSAPVIPPPLVPTVVGQTLTADRAEIRVGDVFSVTATLDYSDGSSKPVTAYSLSGYNKAIVAPTVANAWTRTFTATSAGTTTIKNSNSGTTGALALAVLPAAEVTPPNDVPPVDPPPPPIVEAGTHSVRATSVIDGVAWVAQAVVGEDPQAAGQCKSVLDASGVAHPALLAFFYADCCEIGAVDGRDGFDYAGSLTVEYDGAVVYDAAAVQFYNNTMNQTVRYGAHQPAWHPVDPSLFPNYASSDAPIPLTNLAKFDWSYNGAGYKTVAGSMSAPGMRPEIAYVPATDVPFIAQPSDATYAAVRKVADNTGYCPIYAIDRDTGHPFDIATYPNATQMTQMQATFEGNPIAPYQNKKQWGTSGSPNDYNGAHAPGFNIVAAAATGSARDRFHVAAWANAQLLEQAPNYRASSGLWAHNQTRKTAWALRSIFAAKYLSDMPEYFAARLEAEGRIQGERQVTNPMGFSGTYLTRNMLDGSVGEAPWESDYERLVIGVIAKKEAPWQTLADRLKVHLTAFFGTKWWQFSTHYVLAVTDAAGNPYTTVQDIIRHALPSTWSAEDISAVLADDVTAARINALIVKNHATNWAGKSGDFDSNYPYSMQDYPAMKMAAIATMCGDGPEWKLSQSVPTKPQWRLGWQWNIVPRVA